MSRPSVPASARSSRIRAVVGLAMLATVLAGCSPASNSVEASPSTSVEERAQSLLAEERLAALVEPLSPLPSPVEVTPAGSTLTTGEWAVVGREWASDQTVMTVGFVPVSASWGDLETDFAYLPDDERAKLGDVTPLYVEYQFALLEGERMYPAVTAVQLLLSDGSVADIPVIIGGMGGTDTRPFCPQEPAAADFPQEIGDVYRGCKIFLVPEGLEAANVQWSGEGIYTTDGVRWPIPFA